MASDATTECRRGPRQPLLLRSSAATAPFRRFRSGAATIDKAARSIRFCDAMKFPRWLSKSGAIGLVTGAIAAVGVIKTIAEIGTGTSLSIQQVAYYLGAAAIAVYIGVVVVIVVAAVVMLPLSYATGHGDDPPDGLAAFGVSVGALAAVFMLYLLMTGPLADYEGTDAFGRASIALLGVAAVAGGIYLARRWGSEKNSEPAR